MFIQKKQKENVMPCSSGDWGAVTNTRAVEVRVDNPELKKKIEEQEKLINGLEGALCAICNELDRRKILNDVVSKASKSGFIDILTWWHHHEQSDRSRLAADIHKRYSVDELAVIAQIIK